MISDLILTRVGTEMRERTILNQVAISNLRDSQSDVKIPR
jgi:hypothetical protein